MAQAQTGEILRIHLSEADRFQGRPLYEAIVARCRELVGARFEDSLSAG